MVLNGRWQSSFKGLARHTTGAWYYAVNGKILFYYEGIVRHGGSSYYVKNGKLQSGFTGNVIIGGRGFRVVKGKVITK
jgi:hypothetical protein